MEAEAQPGLDSAGSAAIEGADVPAHAGDEEEPQSFDLRGLQQDMASGQTLAEADPQLDDSARLSLERFKRQAELLVELQVLICNELQDDEEISQQLQASPLGAIRGDPDFFKNTHRGVL